MKAFSKTVKEVIKAECGDIPITCRKDGSIVIKKSYFYRTGTSQGWADEVAGYIKNAGLSAKVIGEDHWANWPKTSYFFAIVTEIDRGGEQAQ